jgi:glycerol-3-phosphate acyltransferase PlsY
VADGHRRRDGALLESFCGWNGGKGVATTVGVLLVLFTRDHAGVSSALRHWSMVRPSNGLEQEGAISSLTTMFVIATLVFTIPAYIMFVIVLIRHIPNLKEIFRTV